MLFYVAGLATMVLSLRSRRRARRAPGEYSSMLLGSIAGMVVLAAAENLVTLFVGIELLSIPLYVLCATELRRRTSLEAGLKYLVVGSVGSATLLYGLALIYGATGRCSSTHRGGARRRRGERDRPAPYSPASRCATGLAFKASSGALPPVDARRLPGRAHADHDVHGGGDQGGGLRDPAAPVRPRARAAQLNWGPALAALATVTIVIGNVGAIAQRSLKRMLAWSSVAQAGYLLAGVVVGTELGVRATAFYLAVYLADERGGLRGRGRARRVSEFGDDLRSVENLGRARRCWPGR